MQKNIYNIAPNKDFLRELATYVLAQTSNDFLKLAEVRIFLPNKRSVLKIKEYFVQESANKAVILPKIFALSDISLEEFEFESEFKREIEVGIKPAIKKEERIFLLTRIIRENATNYNLGNITFEASLKLAISLCKIIDEMYKYEIASEKLEELFVHELSEYRQISLSFLKFVIEVYKKELNENERLDFAERNIFIIDFYARILTEKGAGNLVIIAGSTASHPSVKRLVKAILEIKNGVVFLPYIDLSASEKEWAEIDKENNEINHQKHLFLLLKFLGVKRDEIKVIGNSNNEKNNLVSQIMKCGSGLETWKNLEVKTELKWLKLLESETQIQEAKFICAIVREHLENNKSVGIITTDEGLGLKINLFLKRFNIKAVDSSGLTLDKTFEGKFLLEVARLIADDFGIINLLSFLKNGILNSQELKEIENFERKVIRKNNLKSLSDIFGADIFTHESSEKLSEKLKEKLKFLNNICKSIKSKNEIEVGELLGFALKIIENFCKLELVESENWQSIEEVLSFFSNEGRLEKIEKKLFAEILQITLSSRKIWPKQTFDERVCILTPIEARLQFFDCAILAGANLGSWPESYFSPWLSRNMNVQMEMNVESDLIALSAHDFVSHLHQNEVFITLSKQRNGEPALESPLVSRLKIFAKLKNINLENAEFYKDVAGFFDGIDEKKIEVTKPAPKPPVEARPNSISVTNVENIIKNPYGFYANKILGLKKIDDLENDGTAADYGSFVHKVIEEFANIHQLETEKINIANFHKAIELAMKNLAQKNLVNPAWITQIGQIANWFVKTEKRLADVTSKIFSEKGGELVINKNGKSFKLICKADRIEINNEQQINIIDFKTGYYPSKSEVEKLIGAQLVLEGIIAKQGGFENLEPEKMNLGKVVYYNISFSVGGPERKEYDIDLNELEKLAEVELNNLIDDLQNPDVPFLIRPRPQANLQPKYDDYEHLERVEG